jgi:hypothetical protein
LAVNSFGLLSLYFHGSADVTTQRFLSFLKTLRARAPETPMTVVDNYVINVLKKYSISNPEHFRNIFRAVLATDSSYLPDGVGDIIESLVKNKSTLISKGVQGKQKYKEFLDRLDELTTNSNMDAQMKDLVSDFVMSEKNSIGIAPTRDEIVETIRKKFQLKTGKKDLPTDPRRKEIDGIPTEPRRQEVDGIPYNKTMLDNPDYQ